MSQLGAILDIFETTQRPLTLREIAIKLDIPHPMLESMLGFWVQKGKLREVKQLSVCNTCGVKSGCPFITDSPKQYALASEAVEADIDGLGCDLPGCGCR